MSKSKSKGDHIVLVKEEVEQFISADQCLKHARKDKPSRVVIVFIEDDGTLTVRSSNRRFADTITDLLTAQRHLLELSDGWGTSDE